MRIHHLAFTLTLALLALLAAWLLLLSTVETDRAETATELSTRFGPDPEVLPLVEHEMQRFEALPAAAPESPEPQSSEILILGRCVDAHDKPLSGVEFQLKRWLPRAERRENEVFTPLDLRTKDDGRFEIAIPHAASLTIAFSLLDARYAERRWRWNALPPGAREDLGEITVMPGATVRGRLFDFAGAPIREHWAVDLKAIEIAERIGWIPSTSAEKLGEASEHFELRGLRPGKWRITARYPTFTFATAEVELVAGEVREIDLHQLGSRDPWREIVVRTDVPNLMPDPDLQQVKLIDQGGALRSALPPEEYTSELRFIDLDSGLYRLQIEDPLYEPWSLDRVQPSPRIIEAELRGNSALEFFVIDATTRAPIEKYALELMEHGQPVPNTTSYRSRTAGSDNLDKPRNQKTRPDGRTSLAGVTAGDFRFVLQAEGYPARTVEVKNVVANETRSETVELHRGVTLTGLVRWQSSAAPAAGVEVLLFRPALIADGPDSLLLRPNWRVGDEDKVRKEVGSSKTAADGSFRLEGVQPGRWIVIAVSLGPGEQLGMRLSSCPTCAFRENVFVEADAAPEQILLELSPVGSIHGRVSLPEDARRERVALQLFRAIESKTPLITPMYAPQNWDASLVGTTFPDESGHYRFENLIAGNYRLAVAYSRNTNEPSTPEERIEIQRAASNIKELALTEGAQLQCDLDLSAVAPAEVRVQLSAEGGALGTTTLIIQAAPDPTAGPPFDWLQQRASFDARSSAVHSGVLPGRKLIFAIGGDGAWYHVLHQDLDVTGGSTHELSSNVVLHAGEIEVESSEERSGNRLEISPKPEEAALPMSRTSHTLSLNESARARLVLPAGTYILSTESRAGSTALLAEFQWPAGNLVRVKLEAKR